MAEDSVVRADGRNLDREAEKMRGREKKRFGMTSLEKKTKSLEEEKNKRYLEGVKTQIENAFSAVDRGMPRWHICIGCRYFLKEKILCNAPPDSVPGAVGGGVFPHRPAGGRKCPRSYLHLAYSGERPVFDRRWEEEELRVRRLEEYKKERVRLSRR